MKLTELNNNRRAYSTKVLKEQYEMPFNVDNMSMSATRTMLQKIRGLMNESKQSTAYHKNSASSSYMKLVFMEQALADHYSDLRSRPETRIMVENEEVEKSQVVLAAQDLVESIQKMLEEVGQMQVKELPALVSGIESEIGVTESQSYNDQVSAQLATLSTTLNEVWQSLKQALNTVTGQEGGGFDPNAAMGAAPDTGMDMDMGPELGDEEAPEMPPAPTGPAASPEEPMGTGVGRAKR